FRSIATVGSATASCSVWSSRRWCGPAWAPVWSRVKPSRSMPASWKRTPVVIMPRHPTRSTGRCRNVRRVRLPSFSVRLWWPERCARAVAVFRGALDDEDPDADRKLPKAISPVDPCSAWTAKANKRVQFGYGLNYLIDIKHAVIVDVEATAARTYDEVAATKT